MQAGYKSALATPPTADTQGPQHFHGFLQEPHSGGSGGQDLPQQGPPQGSTLQQPSCHTALPDSTIHKPCKDHPQPLHQPARLNTTPVLAASGASMVHSHLQAQTAAVFQSTAQDEASAEAVCCGQQQHASQPVGCQPISGNSRPNHQQDVPGTAEQCELGSARHEGVSGVGVKASNAQKRGAQGRAAGSASMQGREEGPPAAAGRLAISAQSKSYNGQLKPPGPEPLGGGVVVKASRQQSGSGKENAAAGNTVNIYAHHYITTCAEPQQGSLYQCQLVALCRMSPAAFVGYFVTEICADSL